MFSLEYGVLKLDFGVLRLGVGLLLTLIVLRIEIGRSVPIPHCYMPHRAGQYLSPIVTCRIGQVSTYPPLFIITVPYY